MAITHVSVTRKDLNLSSGDPATDSIIDRWDADQVCWDQTVLCAFEATHPGADGVLDDHAALMDWLETPAAQPALSALASARRGEWISPREWNAASAFWRSLGTA